MNVLSLTVRHTPDGLAAAAQTLLKHAGETRVWCLKGDLGAGKTTLTRAVCTQLGVSDNVCSPTFSLIHEYATTTGTPVYHFDLYRLQHEEEVLELDCMAYFDSGSYCFVEWPERIPNLLPAPHYQVHLTTVSEDCRLLEAVHVL